MIPKIAALLNHIEDTLYRKARLLVRDPDTDQLILIIDADEVREIMRNVLVRHLNIGEE